LVEASFDQIGQLKKADKDVNLDNRNVSTCDNPTFIAGQPNRNYLAEIAPMPPECDKVGNGPCEDGGYSGVGDPPKGGGDGSGDGSGSGSGSGSGDGSGSGSGTTGSGDPGGGGQVIDPDTGEVIGATESTSTGVAGVPTDVAAFTTTQTKTVLALLAIALLVAVVAVPPIMNRRMKEGKA
jgi:hypothetical protein